MTSFGERLRTERKRLKLTQAELANLGGLQKNAQLEYESEVKSPTAEYLLKLMGGGVDVAYLFSGIRSDLTDSPLMADLLRVLSDLPPAKQAMGFAVLCMFRQGAAEGPDGQDDADVIWRAARLFDQFLRMDKRGRKMVETAVAGVMPFTSEK